MLIYGVPMEVDTGSNESGHKATKKAAKLTQRNEATFDYQTAMRLEELHLIDLAIQEIAGRAPFNYGELRNSLPTENPNTDNISIGGAKYHMKYDEEQQEYVAIIKSDTKEEGDEKLEKDLINFIAQLAHLVKPHINCLYLRTKHTRNGQIFRAHNKFRGEVWRDWAIIDWGEEGHLPNKLLGFLDLRALPEGNNCTYAGTDLNPGIYAVVENAYYVDDDEEKALSEIFVPITKEIGGLTGNMVSHMKLYLADVEAIVRPIAVLPDLGGPPNNYFLVKDRERWREDFIEFLEKDMDIEQEISDDDEE